MQTLNVQGFAGKTKYIVGKYDLEVLTNPRTYIPDVEISQSHTTTVEVPQPGIASFSKRGHGYGSVYINRNNELELVATLSETKNRESFELQPGNYIVVFRPSCSREVASM